MTDLAIVSHIVGACSVHFDNPDMAIAWIKLAFGQLSVEDYIAGVMKIDPSVLPQNIHNMITACLGAGV